jgi:hypothetical protein
MRWPVFPLKPRAKEPLTPHGYKDATLDERQIREWVKKWPAANIGVPTGTRFWVLDVDPRNGGNETLEALIAKHGQLPDTLQQMTGGAGRHFLFELPETFTPKSGHLADGLDIKGEGGYIVVAPSVHPSGRAYVWDGARKISEQPLLPAPPWLLAEIEAANHSGRGPVQVPERIPKGKQHTTLFKMGTSMRAKGFEEEEIFAALWAANTTRCEAPGPEANIRKLAASICSQYQAGSKQEPQSAPQTLHVDVGAAPPSLALLNAVALFNGRIRFTSLRRRGSMIQAGFDNGREAWWPTATDLRTFARSQDRLLDATGFLIPTPTNKAIKRTWEPVAQLIRTLADQDATNIEPPLKDEFEQIIRATWVRAGTPQAFGREEFFKILQACQNYKRDHVADRPPRCCVWIGAGETSEGSCWIYQDALLSWLSTPVAKARHYPWDDVRTALLLLDFQPRELHRSLDGQRVHVRVWQGPLDLLVDDETVPESDL